MVGLRIAPAQPQVDNARPLRLGVGGLWPVNDGVPSASMVIALYSKGRFEKEARSLGVGDVFAIDRYTSKHKTFETLKDGGALFVVTVRPGDVLWLVAVLKAPKKKGGAWISASNGTPIVDITSLVPKIEFASGKGLKVGKGKLGMSLQTPRALSDGDIEMLRAAASGSVPKKAKKAGKKAKKAAARKRSAKAAGVTLDEVAAHLGKGWEVDGDALLHTKTGARFAYVPGGWLRMGFSLDDIYEACCARGRQVDDESDWLGEQIARSRPSHVVNVTPFVMAIGKHERSKAFKGFRAPSEAEIEWVYRRGGEDRWVGVPGDRTFRGRKRWSLLSQPDMPFGIDVDYDGHEHCADSWHDSYVGAPKTSEPWGEGGEVLRCLHTLWQDDDEEMISVHAAYRDGPSSAKDELRPTMALPKFAPGRAKGAAPEAIEADALLDALRGGDKKALSALTVLARAPADDAGVVAKYLVDNLPTDVRKLRHSLGSLATMSQTDTSIRKVFPGRLAALLDHADKGVRRHAAMLVGDAKKLAKRLSQERDESVAATIVLSLAQLGRKAPDTGDAKLERALEPIRAIGDGLRGKPDYDRIIASVGKKLPDVPWFGGSLAAVTLELLRKAPTEVLERCEPRERLAVLFEERKTPLRLEEMTPSQRAVIASMTGPLQSGMGPYGLPSSQLGWDVLVGTSTSSFARQVETSRGKMSLFHALLHSHANDESTDELLRDRSMVELLTMASEAADDKDLSDWRYSERPGKPWPLDWIDPQIELIKSATAQERTALRKAIVAGLVAPTKHWPHPYWPVHLAVTLKRGETFPAELVPQLTSRGLHEFRTWEDPPVHFPEPALNDWLFEHIVPVLRDFVAQEATILWPIALYNVWSPELHTSTILVSLAANLDWAYDVLEESPTMKKRYWKLLPKVVHDYDDKPREAVKALLGKATQLRKAGD